MIFCSVNFEWRQMTTRHQDTTRLCVVFFFMLLRNTYINHEHRWAHLLDIKINRNFVCSSIENKTISMKTKTAHKMIGSLMWLPFCIFACAIFFFFPLDLWDQRISDVIEFFFHSFFLHIFFFTNDTNKFPSIYWQISVLTFLRRLFFSSSHSLQYMCRFTCFSLILFCFVSCIIFK